MVHHDHHHVPRRYQKLFQDAISVTIPLDLKKTADLGIAMKRTRAKRIQALQESFPSLIEQSSSQPPSIEEDDNNNTSDNAGEEKKESDSSKKRKKQNDHIPQRDQYASVLDYLEAKYVQGVMIDDEDQANDESGAGGHDDDDDDKGSVYESDNSFLDDSLLKRHVTEQVLSQSIQTKKLNTKNSDDDEDEEDGFFVNVGNLEVEDVDNLMDYDPLADDTKENKATKKKTTKRKRTTSTGSTASTPSSPKKKKAVAASKKSSTSTASSSPKKTKSPTKSNKDDAKSPKKELTAEEKQHLATLKQKAAQRKRTMEQYYNQVVELIKTMTPNELPRRKKKKHLKLSIVVPPGKQAGDNITFSNPHVAGQKLRAKVPKDSVPGGKFVVSVPVPPKEDDDDVGQDNKFTRHFQDLLDDYSIAFDEWTHAQADYCDEAKGEKKFAAHQSRMNKFDEMIALFPKNLQTPVDGVYLRKVVRRARQNKQKRSKTASKQEVVTKEDENDDEEKEQQQEEKQEAQEDTATTTEKKPAKAAAVAAPEIVPTVKLVIPGKGTTFPKLKMNQKDFAHH